MPVSELLCVLCVIDVRVPCPITHAHAERVSIRGGTPGTGRREETAEYGRGRDGGERGRDSHMCVCARPPGLQPTGSSP